MNATELLNTLQYLLKYLFLTFWFVLESGIPSNIEWLTIKIVFLDKASFNERPSKYSSTNSSVTLKLKYGRNK